MILTVRLVCLDCWATIEVARTDCGRDVKLAALSALGIVTEPPPSPSTPSTARAPAFGRASTLARDGSTSQPPRRPRSSGGHQSTGSTALKRSRGSTVAGLLHLDSRRRSVGDRLEPDEGTHAHEWCAWRSDMALADVAGTCTSSRTAA